MRYLAAQLDLNNAQDAAEIQRAMERLQQRIEDLLAHRVVYAPDYPLSKAA
jgi:isopentenyl phosphate kinase